jgi:hypothetical protein
MAEGAHKVETNIRAAIMAHWKRFIWMWLLPPAFLASALIPAFSRNPLLFFLAIDLPAFFACYYVASKPVRKREVSVGLGVVLLVVIPFILWAILIFGLFEVAQVLGQK